MDDELNTRLKPLRERIDAIDAQILALLNQRAAVAQEVGQVKKQTNAPVFRPEREAQVIARLQDMSDGPLASDDISTILREIMSACRALEKTRHGRLPRPGRHLSASRRCSSSSAVDRRPAVRVDRRSVPRGRGRHRRLRRRAGREFVRRRGQPHARPDAANAATISGEVALPIHHNLMTQTGSMDGVTRVCAHSQALAQCQRWLQPQRAAARAPRGVEQRRSGAHGGGGPDRRGDRRRMARRRSTAWAWCRRRSRTTRTTARASSMIGKQPTGPCGHDQTSLIAGGGEQGRARCTSCWRRWRSTACR